MLRFRHRSTRRSSPTVSPLEPRQLLSRSPFALPATPIMEVELSPRSAAGDPAMGVASSDLVRLSGQTMPRRVVGVDMNGDGQLSFRGDRFTISDSQGRFNLWLALEPGLNMVHLNVVRFQNHMPMTELMLMCPEPGSSRAFDGSPTAPEQPFGRLIPNSASYAPNAAARPDPRQLSASLAEDPNNPAFSDNIPLGMVFFGQFVDHDITLMKVVGQGPTPDPLVPLNVRTPALDLDSVYGQGPAGTPQFYTDNGLFFRLPAGKNDLLREPHGRAIIGDERNDENGQIAKIHLSFQRLHNTLMRQALDGHDPAILTTEQNTALFNYVRRNVIGYYQGIVANKWIPMLTGRPLPRNIPALDRMPVELTAAVYRLGHTLVPNRVVVDHQGTTLTPVDPSLRGPGAGIPFTLLFGPNAQPAARLDDQIAQVMRELLIPVSPTDPDEGNLVGGHVPNIGSGHIIDGMMHLDLIETNLMRGREQKLPSGEEYLAAMRGRPYNPATDGNTDLFVYMLRETVRTNRLGPVGADIVNRSFGGILAADPYRYDNPAVFSRQEIRAFRSASMEGLLARIGEPGF